MTTKTTNKQPTVQFKIPFKKTVKRLGKGIENIAKEASPIKLNLKKTSKDKIQVLKNLQKSLKENPSMSKATAVIGGVEYTAQRTENPSTPTKQPTKKTKQQQPEQQPQN